jgi:hypothetical protein
LTLEIEKIVIDIYFLRLKIVRIVIELLFWRWKLSESLLNCCFDDENCQNCH